MAAARQPVNAHDAEEAMRPLLGRVYDTSEAMLVPVHDGPTGAYIDALRSALAAALDLLGVQS